MKALLINGSPHEKGCTFTALQYVIEGLAQFDIEAEVVWLGKEPFNSCVACGACRQTQRCAYGNDDGINAIIEKAAEADALIVGSPVHYAGITGATKTALDRIFFAGASLFAHKVGAGLVSARRAGTTAALEQLNKYFLISQMMMPGSTYWPMVHGREPEDVHKDEEGCQIMQQLGANVGWLLKSIEEGKKAGLAPYKYERKWTHFIQ